MDANQMRKYKKLIEKKLFEKLQSAAEICISNEIEYTGYSPQAIQLWYKYFIAAQEQGGQMRSIKLKMISFYFDFLFIFL